MSQAPPLEPGLVFSLLGDIYSHTASATLEPTCLHTVAEKFGSVWRTRLSIMFWRMWMSSAHPHPTCTVASFIVHCDVILAHEWDGAICFHCGKMQSTQATSPRAGPRENYWPGQWTAVCLSLGIGFWETKQD